MPSFSALKNAAAKYCPPEPTRDELAAWRSRIINLMFEQGGKVFLDFFLKCGATDRGNPILYSNWLLEYAEAIGDFRIPECYTTGPSQNSKTMVHTNLLGFCILEARLNALWTYAQERQLNQNVPLQFRPSIRAMLASRGDRNTAEDTQNNRLYQFKGASAIFSYVSTSKPADSGGAAAGSAVVSFTADVLFTDERSQYPPGSADPLPRRLDASAIPTRPQRHLGTPGAGLGIEKDIQRCDRQFYPHVVCPGCGSTIAIDPKGCLLKEAEIVDATGKVKRSYLSESGRPIIKTENGKTIAYWHHHDPESPVDTAYFGCSKCGHELTEELRSQSFFQCLKTGIKLRSFLDSLPPGIPTDYSRVGIHLTPLTRVSKINEAARLVREGFDLERSTDWQQQGLGHPSESDNTSVPRDLIQSLIGAPTPLKRCTFILAGADQGRGEDWLWIAAFYCPPGWERMPISEVCDRTIRVVQFAGDIVRRDIPAKLKEYMVDYGIFDNEPDIADIANNICRVTVMEMADQRSGQADAMVESVVRDGGEEYKCWKIRNEKFLKQVLTNFFTVAEDGLSLYRLPAAWGRWVGMDSSERSPIVHLSGPSYDPSTGKWKRGEGNIDDLYYAAMFCEAAFYKMLLKNKKSKAADWLKRS